MAITRIIAAATIASALAFVPSAFAEGSPAPQATHGGMMHDGARPDADCGCHGARNGGDASKHEFRANGDRGQGDKASEAGTSWSSRNR
jgi:hypothetical protein